MIVLALFISPDYLSSTWKEAAFLVFKHIFLVPVVFVDLHQSAFGDESFTSDTSLGSPHLSVDVSPQCFVPSVKSGIAAEKRKTFQQSFFTSKFTLKFFDKGITCT